jgi:hypothetical protein
MPLGRPQVALILTGEERVRLESLAMSFSTVSWSCRWSIDLKGLYIAKLFV